ncbi:MAG: hypothetical protein HFE78_06600 [Clostridiales bacterium]|nr:hypothetical protein [Clostridiales bacterium]
MAQKKGKQRTPVSQSPNSSKKRFVIISLLLLLLAGTVLTIIFLRPGKKNDDASRPAPTTIVSIIYPELQDNGQIVYTNTFIETRESNLYGALEQLADKIQFTYDETGALLTAGRLRPQSDEKLLIKQNTQHEQIDLGKIPSAVSLEDGATYEIMLADEKGDPLYQTEKPTDSQ